MFTWHKHINYGLNDLILLAHTYWHEKWFTLLVEVEQLRHGSEICWNWEKQAKL
jgi:hypothetical protein